jgi:hypothetical protein
MVNRLGGRGSLGMAVVCMLLISGCGTAGRGGHPSARVASATDRTGSAPAGLVRQAQQYLHGASCSAMQLTSPTAIAFDVAANVADNQFGSGHGISAQLDFVPASAKADGGPYAEFDCTKNGRNIAIWYEEVGGVWVPMNGGFSVRRGLSESLTQISIPAPSRSNPKLVEEALQKDFSNVFASSGTPVRPACSVSDSQKDDYYCVVTNTSTHLSIIAVYHVVKASGMVFSLKVGNSASTQSVPGGTDTETATTQQSGTTAPDLYDSCADTVASYHDTIIGLETFITIHSNRNAMYKDLTALGQDFDLMSQQAETAGNDAVGTTFEEAYGVYTADAVSVQNTDILEPPPSRLGAALRQSCPSSFAAAGLTGGGTSSGGPKTSGSDSGSAGGTAASESTDCGLITAPGGATFNVDFHLGSCAQALVITRAYIQVSSTDLSAGRLPGNATVNGWKCSVSVNDPKLVQFFCIGGASGQEVEGIVKQAKPATTPSADSIVAALNQSFMADPPKLCAHGLLCTQDPMCNVASATVALSQVDVDTACSALAQSLTAAGTDGSWAAQSETNTVEGTGCNLMGTGPLDSTDLMDVVAISGTSAASLCQALEASGDWEGQAG